MLDKIKEDLKKAITEFTIEDFNIYTMNELYMQIANKTNEVIEIVKLLQDYLDEQIFKDVENIELKQNVLENIFNQLIINAGNSNAEIVDARIEADGTTHNKLRDRLNKVDSQIKEKANITDLEVERARIDSFTQLQEGSTTGDAELVDARVGADGVTYSNVGSAIRGQITNINESKNSWASVFFFEGKNPYWDTVNKTFTIYSGSPILVNGLSYVPKNDIVLPMIKINKTSYLGIYIDLSQSLGSNIVLDVVSMQEMTNTHKVYSNYALIAVFNIDSNIYQANFVMNIDGVLQYSTTKEMKKYVNETTNEMKKYVNETNLKILYGEAIDIFDYTFVDGEYIEFNTGNIIANDTVSRTDYICINGLSNIHTYVGANSTHQLAYFDENKTYITGQKTNIKGDWKLSPPSNAYYVVIALLTENKDTFYVKASMDVGGSINGKYKTMKMNCLGDSITYGYIPDDGSQMTQPYPSILQNLLGFNTCRNYGISGSTLAVNSGNYNPMSVRYADMDDDADIVSVFGGTNDYGRAKYSALGTINDTTNDTIYGALDVLCNGLINKYPKAFIFFMTPLRRADKIGNNGGGYLLEDVANAIKEVCYKYSIPVLDLYSKGGCHLENTTFRGHYGGNDKLHVNQSFMLEHLAPMIEKFIRSNI